MRQVVFGPATARLLHSTYVWTVPSSADTASFSVFVHRVGLLIFVSPNCAPSYWHSFTGIQPIPSASTLWPDQNYKAGKIPRGLQFKARDGEMCLEFLDLGSRDKEARISRSSSLKYPSRSGRATWNLVLKQKQRHYRCETKALHMWITPQKASSASEGPTASSLVSCWQSWTSWD